MGEKSIVEIADALNSGMNIKDITYIKGTVYKTKDISLAYDPVVLPSYDEMKENNLEYAKSFKIQYDNTSFHRKCFGRTISKRCVCGSESATGAAYNERNG